ncbi:Pkinase domain-containing protein [Rhizoctonia solani AG-1 IA]|uniref:Pkinase domain-containing protein n=1 Tax=Thanatephorus cucumeris (strain AG1-IA) TaxID=983506 RepID=L8WVT3_THACA|nr:Pkinase domain-containing protein [Rhizoctonia solani AG-1 IA]
MIDTIADNLHITALLFRPRDTILTRTWKTPHHPSIHDARAHYTSRDTFFRKHVTLVADTYMLTAHYPTCIVGMSKRFKLLQKHLQGVPMCKSKTMLASRRSLQPVHSFGLVLVKLQISRQSSESSVSLDSDSDIAIQSDGETEFALPSPIICPDVETVCDTPLSTLPPNTNGDILIYQEINNPIDISEEPVQIESNEEPMITTDMVLYQAYIQWGGGWSHGCNDVTSELDESKCSQYALSHGGFGDVFRGALRNGTRVGIKCLKIQLDSSGEREKHLKQAARELYVWSKCEHPNVLPLIGMALFEGKFAMVSPWMENGTLTRFISQHPEADRYEMSNIVVSRDFTPKLADFGNSWLGNTIQSLRFSETTSVPSMSIRWAVSRNAPEVFQGTVKSSAEADVYALGMVNGTTFLSTTRVMHSYNPPILISVQETISGCVPYREFSDIAVIPRILDGKHPERSELQGPLVVTRGDRLWSILTRCWDRDPRNRPTSKEVRDEASGLFHRGAFVRDLPFL